ncbi:MAG: hypothetical protein Q4D54_07820, partial [Eubacteriales bacterium]|nr:hypothetical protein [Eubacteriales bacterium]
SGMPQPGMVPQGMPPQGMQPMYGQQPQAPKPPKAPRKPLSTGAKVGIIAGIVAVILAIVFFVVILPILKRSDLKGEYTYKDSWGDEYVAVFDDGTFVIHYYDGDDIYAAGTYTIKDNKVELRELDGDTYDGTFNEDDNMIKVYGMKFTSSNKKAKADYKLDEDYLDNLTAQIKTFTEKAIGDEDIYDELYWGSYVTGSDLDNPYTEYLKQLASELNYSSNVALQDLMGTGYLEFYVYINYNDEIEISSYVY